jgi:hypothetical protein
MLGARAAQAQLCDLCLAYLVVVVVCVLNRLSGRV